MWGIKHKNEMILGGIAAILLAALAYAFIWGVGFIALNVSKAITAGSGAKTGASFDLEGAKRLNLKGLAQ